MESTCESCGWAAAVVAILSFGSFGVPIKSETCRRLNIDPLVFHSYKSVVCFLFAALTMVVTGHQFRFTPWGIVSALFWVPGGVATVAAVKLAGLALAIAVGNSLIALVSFSWGIFVFKEPIHSQSMACVAVALMVLGFSGMSYFSTRTKSEEATTAEECVTLEPVPGRPQLMEQCLNSPANRLSSIPTCPDGGAMAIELVEEARQLQSVSKEIHDFEDKTFHSSSGCNQPEEAEKEGGGLRHRQVQHLVHHHSNEMVYSPKQVTALDSFQQTSPVMISTKSFFNVVPQSSNPQATDTLLTISNHWKLSRRQVGIGLAIFNGCYGGSIMAPLKLCPDPTITRGVGYVWSFSIGAVLVTAALWVLRYMWILAETGSLKGAYQALPPLHLQEMWKPGGLSGLLWSIGNVFSILAVEYLGEGVGYCVCQASMLVSGAYGIFYFHEVKGAPTISKWFLSALLTVFGILLLSYEHHEA